MIRSSVQIMTGLLTEGLSGQHERAESRTLLHTAFSLTQSGSCHSAAAAARAALSSCCFLATSASLAVRFAASSACSHVAAVLVNVL